MKKNLKLVSILCSIATVCFGGGVAAMYTETVSAETPKTMEFSMVKGASIRLRANSNGMRFSAAIPQADYEAMESDSVSYGILIMPEEYLTTYGELTVENVFGANAKYCWGSEQANKTRIINITYEDLGEVVDGEYIIRGSITNVLEKNLGRDFVARAYINDNGTYEMADYAEGHVIHNTRSMLDVAESALSDTSSQAITDTQKTAVRGEYLSGYTAISTYEEFCAMASDGRYYLANDIDFTGHINNGNGDNGAFLSAQAFSGKFYGNGYALKNVTIGAATASYGSYRSLFGTLSGTIRDVKISATVNTTNAAGLYGDAVIANKMTDGVIDGVTLNVKFEKANNKGYNEGASWSENTSISAGMVQNFLQGVIKNSTVTIETPTNVSTTDGIVAVSNVNWTAGYDNTLRLLDNVQVYAKSDGMKLFVNQSYANPTTLNCGIYASLADSILIKDDGVAVENDMVNGYTKTTKYASADYQTGLETVKGIELAKYSKIEFAYKQTSAKRYFILYSVYDDQIYVGQATEWTNISLQKQADGLWSLYVNGELCINGGKPMVDLYGIYLSDIINYVEFGGTGEASDYYLSNVTAVKDDSYQAPTYIKAQNCIFTEGAVSTDYVAEGATLSTKIETDWGVKTFALNNEENYQYLKFYVMATTNHFELDVAAPSQDALIAFDGTNQVFHKIEFVKMADGTWVLYFDTQIKAAGLQSINDMWVRMNGTFYVSEVLGLHVDGYVRPVLPSVMDNPISKAATSTNASDLAEGAILTNDIAGGWVNGGTSLNALDLAPYTEVKFFFKTDGVAYFEVLNAATPTTFYYGNRPTDWTEVRLTKEGNAWRLYVAGEWKDFTCTNLNALNVQLGSGAIFQVSNLMGTPDPSYVAPVAPVYEVISENVFDLASTASTETAPDGFTTVVSHTTSWNKYNFNSFDLTPFIEVKFAVKSSGWYGVMNGDSVINETNGGGDWLVISLVKAENGWDLYYDDAKQGNYAISNLTEFNFRFGTATYLVTELQGSYSPTYVRPVSWTNGEQPFALTEGVAVADDIAEGFTTSTSFTTSWNKYNFKSFDLTPFIEVKFAVKSAGYYGVMSGDSVIGETNNGSNWLTIELQKNGSDWDLYYGGTNKQTLTLANNNLTDLNFRFGGNTYLVSEMIAIRNPEWLSSYTVLSNNPVKKAATSTSTYLSSVDSYTTNVIHCGWTGTNFVDGVKLNNLTEIKFFYKVDDINKYLELCDASGNAYYAGHEFNWTEVKFLPENGSWTLYVDGVSKKTGLTGTTLHDLVPTVRLGGSATANVYLSELLVKESGTLNVVVDGGSDYTIVYDNADAQTKVAAEELQRYMGEATGVTLSLAAYNGQEKKGNYIFVGGGLAKSAGLSFEGLTMESYYNLESVGRAIYVYGNAYYGTKNGVYALLNEWFNYQAYAEGVFSIDSATDLRVEPFAKLGGLEFDYQFAGYGMISDLKSPNTKLDEQLGFITDYMVSGGGIHNALALIPKETYGAAHPNWFYTGTTSDGSNTGDQLYLAAENFATGEGTLVTTVAQQLADVVIRNPHLKIISFSAMDIDIWPNGTGYGNSDSLKNTYGTYAAEMIIFMNAVAKEMESMIDGEITLQMLAYNKTLCAPKLDGLTAEQKARIMLYQGSKVKVAPYIAPVEANYTLKFDDANNKVKNPATGVIDDGSSTVGKVIEDWEAISEDMFLWWYALDANSYFMVMDTISNMQAQYQFAKAHGVTVMYTQAHYDTPVSSDWASLKIYLQSVLAKDVNADMGAAIDEFMNNYFGAAASSMKSLLTKQQQWYSKLRGNSKQDSGYNLGRLRGSAFFTAGTGNKVQWTYNLSTSFIYGGANKMIDEWLGYIDDAKEAINNDGSLTAEQKAEYLKRIEIEALTVRYIGAKVFEKETVDAVYVAAKALGFTHSAEGTPIA